MNPAMSSTTTNGYRVLVAGTREGVEDTLVDTELTRIAPDVIIEGGASGVDKQAASWARVHDVELVTFPADWQAHGKAAGPIRNQQMLDEGQPDLVVAFPIAGSRGTLDMIRRAERAGVAVRIVDVSAGAPKGFPYEQSKTKASPMSHTMIEMQSQVLVSDQFVSVPVGWADTEWNALIAHDEWVISLWVDHQDSPATTAVLAAIPRREVHLAEHQGDPADDGTGSACGCEEMGWWCARGDGRKATFVAFDRRDLTEALCELGAIIRGVKR